MTLGRRIWNGAAIAFVVAVLLELLYDTSANVSALEGGRHHLQFGTAVLIAFGSAAGGAIVGGLTALDQG